MYGDQLGEFVQYGLYFTKPHDPKYLGSKILFQGIPKESTQCCTYLFHPQQKNKLLVGHGQISSTPEVQASPACHHHLMPTMHWFFYLIMMTRALMSLEH